MDAFAAPFLEGRDLAKSEIPDNATTVLLGECTHGTHEFYKIRAEITKYLIEVRKFKIVLCEADWPFLWHANQYIHRKRSHMFPREEDGERVRFPDWMWRNEPFIELIEWMRKRASNDGPYLFGMDCYCKDESKEEVMKFLDRHDRRGLGTAFRRTCFPKDQPERWPDILAKLQWEIQNEDAQRAPLDASADGAHKGNNLYRGCSKLDQFNCEQNIACLISADEYYSKQKLEPPGSNSSWNARDQHMMTVILGLKGLGKDLFGEEDVKVVVWAHNSHVGDASALPLGGAEFKRNEKWNLGQMCRSTLNNVFIVGFYSYEGTVRAAERWGGEGKVMNLKQAQAHSLEHHLHRWFRESRGFFALRRLCKALAGAPKKAGKQLHVFDHPLDVEYCALHSDLYFTPEGDASKKETCAEESLGAADDDLRMMQMRKIKADPDRPFIAVKRETVDKHGTVRLLTDKGMWITEFTPHGSRRIHCLPKEQLDLISGSLADMTMEKFELIVQHPILQRWVGVLYHPETEIQSHYGEMLVGNCYDLVAFVDRTKALQVDVESVTCEDSAQDNAIPTAATSTSAQTNRRLLIEYRRIMKDPIDYIVTRPLDANLLEWHFVITGCQEPYTGGKYHGILEFPDDFPMKPPSIKLLTPSGRFEVNKRICLSMSDFHAESWNPSWTVEKILIGLVSFMYEDSTASIGSILESYAKRKTFAAESEYFNVQNEIYCELFCAEMQEDELRQKQKSRKLFAVGGQDLEEDINENGRVCRFCLMDSGELVSPCACKGTGEFVHVACLRQWQKSVVLTQPTHPKYQTQIDAICNICETPFKDAYKPVSRRSVIMEYLKDDSQDSPPITDLVCVGNLLVSSRTKSARGLELAERAGKQEDPLYLKLGHFMEAVYFITLYDRKGRRGGGSVLAVNIARHRQCPGNSPLSAVEFKMPMTRGRIVNPLRVWQQEFVPLIETLFSACSMYNPGSLEHFIGQSVESAEVVFDPSSIEHFIGGPVEPAHPFALAEMRSFEEVMRHSTKFTTQSVFDRHLVKNDLFFGDLDALLNIVAEYVRLANSNAGRGSDVTAKAALKVFWGYASWDGTQLLGEIARRSWGLAVTDEHLGLLNESWEFSSSWEKLVETTVMARDTEFSRA